MKPFRRHGERIRMTLRPFDADLLRSVQASVRAALDGADPRDPVVARLFPPAVAGDDAADRELRGLLYDDLLASRLAGLDALVAILDRADEHRGNLRTDLDDDEPLLVLGVLNDIRLAIGARIGIDRVERDELDGDDPRWQTIAVIDHFAWLQEHLIAIVDPSAAAIHRDPEALD